MKKLRTLAGQPLRSEYTALESAVLIHAANYCVKDETFIGDGMGCGIYGYKCPICGKELTEYSYSS